MWDPPIQKGFGEGETVDEILLIIGGTEDQPIQHDIARQTVIYIPNVAEKKWEEGWEHQRLLYNNSIARSDAPSSILLGLQDSAGDVVIGIDREQITFIKNGETKCRVENGDGKIYDILQKNMHLAVIKASGGYVFTGDFRHAGVWNIAVQSQENDSLILLSEKFEKCSSQDKDIKGGKVTEEAVKVMCSWPGVSGMSRLHVLTQFADKWQLPKHYDIIGFTDCRPNPRDERCLDFEWWKLC